MKKLLSRPAAAILLAYLLLAPSYSALAPVFESSDEPHHFPYVAHIARGLGLPVQQPGSDSRWQDMWRQEASQPPLYYILAAALVRPLDLSDLEQLHTYNPHARVGIPLAVGNKNLIIHSDRESFPWRGVTLAVHLVRLFSVLLGAGTVLCTYLLGKSLVPGRPAVALGAMAANAFLPMFLFISASVNNDNLVVFLASLATVWLVRCVLAPPERAPGPRSLIPLGVLIGLAALTKLTGLALLPLAFLALLLRRGPISGIPRWLPGYVRDCLLVATPALAVAGWWYARNLSLYGDPTGLNAMLDVAGRRDPTPSLAGLAREFEGFRINFWGLFGAVNVLMRPAWAYRLLDALSLAALAGIVLALVRVARGAARLPGSRWKGWFVAATWVAVVFLSLVRWTSMTYASQGRLMFPTISALSVALVAGLAALAEGAGRLGRVRHSAGFARAGAAALPLVLAPLALTAPLLSILPAYAPPPVIQADAIPATAVRYEATYGDVLRVLAAEAGPAEVNPGEQIDITMYWQALQPADGDLSFYLQLIGRDRAVLGQVDSYPGGGALPTSQLVGGALVRDRYRLRVERAPAGGPVLASLEIGMYDAETGVRLAPLGPGGERVSPSVARVKVRGLPLGPARDTLRPLSAAFGGQAELAGYDLTPPQVRPGETLTATLLWRVTAPLDADYTVFLHLRDASGRTVAQGDGPPAGGDYPTSHWAAGEELLDVHSISVPAGAPPGPYTLVGGLYEPVSGRRLFLPDGTETEARIAAMEILR